MPSSRLPRVLSAAVAAAALLAACSQRRDDRPARDIFAERDVAPAVRPLDPARPLAALEASADDVAARLGAFAWQGDVTWTVFRTGAPPVRVSEQHRVRQLATGDFDVAAAIDPGQGPGAVTGKQVVFAGGMTYGRGRWAPFRQRPADRGHDARRYREESFELAADLARLYGGALAAEPAGEAEAMGRRALRYRLSLSGAAPAAVAPPRALPQGGYDADTKRRVALLDGRSPIAADGELLLDAATGVPLSIRLHGAFTERGDAQLRADFELTARVTALGGDVAPVTAPEGALADERKPKGVARALEAAGLRKPARGEAAEDDAGGDDDATP